MSGMIGRSFTALSIAYFFPYAIYFWGLLDELHAAWQNHSSSPRQSQLLRPNHHNLTHRSRRLDIESLEVRRVFALDPTGLEQEAMQLINRFRTDPTNEFSRLIASVSPRRAIDANVDAALTFFNTNVGIVQSQMASLGAVPPIAWDATAQQVAIDYLPYMASAKSSSHDLNGTFQQRIGRYPFDFTLGGTARENAYAGAFSPIHAHAAYVIDWGSGPNGLQGTGHRDNLISSAIKSGSSAFMSVTYDPVSGFGPMLNVQDLMGLGTTKATVTGAIFEDRNGSRWYDAGEGLAGVQLNFQGPAGQFTFSAMSAGGYNAVVPAGTYTVTASGGGMRFPMTISNVVVATQNVWLNFIYDPNSVPADAYENNNAIGSATSLSGSDQTLSGGTISQGDVDYFRLAATTGGLLNIDLQFPAANGNLDLRLLDSSGATVAVSNSSTTRETIANSIVAGRTYYIVVESPTGSIGGAYSLQIDVPTAQAADGKPDSMTTSSDDAPSILDVLANDRDPDGDLARSQIAIFTEGRGAVEILNNGASPTLRYTPPRGYSGIDRFSYVVTDQQGLISSPINVEVMVLDLSAAFPFQNTASTLDVNADGSVTAIDALLVINQLNRQLDGPLPQSIGAARTFFGFVDVNGNGSLEPLDVLLIINSLNGTTAQAEGEGSAVVDLETIEALTTNLRRNRRS